MWTNLFERFAHSVSHLSGKPLAFGLACILILGWAVTGPLFDFSSTWQLVINTFTTIVTFLMVFILQNTQNRDGQALQAKLDELILVSSKAENTFIAAEQLSEHDIRHLREMIAERAETLKEWEKGASGARGDQRNEAASAPLSKA